MIRRRSSWCLVLLAFLAPAGSVAADRPPLVFGMTAALSGPASDLGYCIKEGVELAFRRQNEKGGIRGRPLRLSALDDSYSPETATQNTAKLLADPEVLGFIGNVGTPTTQAVLPILHRDKAVLVGPFTGSGLFRDKSKPELWEPVFHLRTHYACEVDTIIRGLLALGVHVDQLAFFIQDDSYGHSVHRGALKTLEDLGYGMASQLPVGRYTRNTTDVDEGLTEVLTRGATPRAVILAGTHAPCAAFIRKMKTAYPSTLFATISFVGSEGLMRSLGREAHNVIITQVVPLTDSPLPAVQDYRKDLAAFLPEATPNMVSLEGYIAGRTLIAALERSEGDLDRAKVRELITNLKDHNPGLGEGISIGFGADDHEGLEGIWPSIVKVDAQGVAKLVPFHFEKKELE
ncbi:MAG: ABC transporter substrate-binding protein [Planctomycetota bacterium]